MTENTPENPKPKRSERLMLIIPTLISITWAATYSDSLVRFGRYFVVLFPVHVGIFLIFQFLFRIFKIDPGKVFKLGFYWGLMVAGPYTLHQYLMHYFIKLPQGLRLDTPTILWTLVCYMIPAIEVGILFAWVALIWLRYRRKWNHINPFVGRWIIGVIISCTVFIPLLIPKTGSILLLNHPESEPNYDLSHKVFHVKGLRNPYFELYLERNEPINHYKIKM